MSMGLCPTHTLRACSGAPLLSDLVINFNSNFLYQDDPEISFTEDDYRRRRAHPNFKSHISAEKLVIKHGKTNKAKFITYVVASGLTYGSGEEIFHFLFKTAWHGQAPALQCFGNGQNIVPTIHIKDLAAVIVNICDQNPKVRYLVAVDDSKSTLEEIVKVGGNRFKMMLMFNVIVDNRIKADGMKQYKLVCMCCVVICLSLCLYFILDCKCTSWKWKSQKYNQRGSLTY